MGCVDSEQLTAFGSLWLKSMSKHVFMIKYMNLYETAGINVNVKKGVPPSPTLQDCKVLGSFLHDFCYKLQISFHVFNIYPDLLIISSFQRTYIIALTNST